MRCLPGWFAASPTGGLVTRQPAIKSRPRTPKRAVKGAWTSAVVLAYPVCPANGCHAVLGFAGNGIGAAPFGGSGAGRDCGHAEAGSVDKRNKLAGLSTTPGMG